MGGVFVSDDDVQVSRSKRDTNSPLQQLAEEFVAEGDGRPNPSDPDFASSDSTRVNEPLLSGTAHAHEADRNSSSSSSSSDPLLHPGSEGEGDRSPDSGAKMNEPKTRRARTKTGKLTPKLPRPKGILISRGSSTDDSISRQAKEFIAETATFLEEIDALPDPIPNPNPNPRTQESHPPVVVVPPPSPPHLRLPPRSPTTTTTTKSSSESPLRGGRRRHRDHSTVDQTNPKLRANMLASSSRRSTPKIIVPTSTSVGGGGREEASGSGENPKKTKKKKNKKETQTTTTEIESNSPLPEGVVAGADVETYDLIDTTEEEDEQQQQQQRQQREQQRQGGSRSRRTAENDDERQKQQKQQQQQQPRGLLRSFCAPPPNFIEEGDEYECEYEEFGGEYCDFYDSVPLSSESGPRPGKRRLIRNMRRRRRERRGRGEVGRDGRVEDDDVSSSATAGTTAANDGLEESGSCFYGKGASREPAKQREIGQWEKKNVRSWSVANIREWLDTIDFSKLQIPFRRFKVNRVSEICDLADPTNVLTRQIFSNRLDSDSDEWDDVLVSLDESITISPEDYFLFRTYVHCLQKCYRDNTKYPHDFIVLVRKLVRILGRSVSDVAAEWTSQELSVLAYRLSSAEEITHHYLDVHEEAVDTGFQAIKVKLVITETTQSRPKQFFRKLISPLIDRIEFLRQEFGLFHSALIIGPWYLEWTDSELVIPRQIRSGSAYLTMDLPVISMTTDLTIDDVKSRLATIIHKWNTEFSYSSISHPGQSTLNCQDFVADISQSLGIPNPMMTEAARGPLGDVLRDLSRRGECRIVFRPSEEFIEHFGLGEITWLREYRTKSGYEVPFPSHQHLDVLCTAFHRKDVEGHLNPAFAPEYALLKSFDRAFWLRFLKYPDDERNRPAKPGFCNYSWGSEDYLTGCPFKDPRDSKSFLS